MNFNQGFLDQDDNLWPFFPQIQPILSNKQSLFQLEKKDLEKTSSNFQSDNNCPTFIEIQKQQCFNNSSEEENLGEYKTTSQKQKEEIFEEQMDQNRQIIQKYFPHVFKKKSIRKEGRKNTNVPKFFVRIFIKYFKIIQDFQISPEHLKKFEKTQSQLFKRQTNNFNISNLVALLKTQNKDFQILNRKIMSKILQQKMGQQILNNPSIFSNKKTYLMASKIYKLRCRSLSLLRRVQYR